jgi:anti-sigma B factor antagonist
MPDPQAVAGPSLEVQVAEDADTTRLIFRGELDLVSAAEVKEHLERAMRDGVAQVVVDLCELTFVDSTGIALFVMAKREDAQGRLRFHPSNTAAVRRVLAVTGVDEALGLVDGNADGDGPR